MPQLLRTAVAVPVKDEAERIASCVIALAQQAVQPPDVVVLLINNTTDGTARIVRDLATTLPIRVDVVEQVFPPEQASAGTARRAAMERAAGLLREDGILFTTDADGRVPPDWIDANLYHVHNGADAVAGRAVLDPSDAAAIPPELHAADAVECAYAATLDEIAALLDPDPADPWPRHTEHSGASIAVRLGAYRRAGGMPATPLAEDRRFFAALRATDACVRHALDIEVIVSGRTIGRAEGGMADTIRRRLSALDPYLDGALEPAAAWERRVRFRARFRAAWQVAGSRQEALLPDLARALALPLASLHGAFALPAWGAGWQQIEAESPVLRRCLVAAEAASAQVAEAQRILAGLRTNMLDAVSLPVV